MTAIEAAVALVLFAAVLGFLLGAAFMDYLRHRRDRADGLLQMYPHYDQRERV